MLSDGFCDREVFLDCGDLDKVKEVKLVKYRQGRHSGSGRGHHGFRQRQFSLGWVGRWTDYVHTTINIASSYISLVPAGQIGD